MRPRIGAHPAISGARTMTTQIIGPLGQLLRELTLRWKETSRPRRRRRGSPLYRYRHAGTASAEEKTSSLRPSSPGPGKGAGLGQQSSPSTAEADAGSLRCVAVKSRCPAALAPAAASSAQRVHRLLDVPCSARPREHEGVSAVATTAHVALKACLTR